MYANEVETKEKEKLHEIKSNYHIFKVWVEYIISLHLSEQKKNHENI